MFKKDVSFDLSVLNPPLGSKMAEGCFLSLCKHQSSILYNFIREWLLKSPFTFDRKETFSQILGPGKNYVIRDDSGNLPIDEKSSRVETLWRGFILLNTSEMFKYFLNQRGIDNPASCLRHSQLVWIFNHRFKAARQSLDENLMWNQIYPLK